MITTIYRRKKSIKNAVHLLSIAMQSWHEKLITNGIVIIYLRCFIVNIANRAVWIFRFAISVRKIGIAAILNVVVFEIKEKHYWLSGMKGHIFGQVYPGVAIFLARSINWKQNWK